MMMFDAEAVDRLLDYRGLVEALRQAHAEGRPPSTDRLVMTEPGGSDNAFVSLLAWVPGSAVAAKLVGVFPGNATRTEPQPSVQGLVALFDGNTGAPRLVCDGAALTFRKTAADSALGTSLLARPDAEVLLVVGAGGLAPHVIAAHRAVRPSIRKVMIWNRTPERARDLAQRIASAGFEVQAVDDLDAAVSEADVISAVTMTTTPLIRGRELKPGAHVDLIGAYRPDMREADDDVVRRARLFVDTRVNCMDSGDLSQPLARGLISPASIEADLYDLCSAASTFQRKRSDITLFKNVGGAHLDLFTVRYLATLAG